MKRKILIGGGVVALLLGTALAAPSFVDWNKYKGQIVGQLENATGHDYEIQGPLQLSILPFPHVSVDGLNVKTPKEQGGETLLTLERAAISVQLLPLLHGDINISSITLDKPVFNVSIGQDGTPSWMTPKLKEQQGAQGSTPQPQASMSDKIKLQSVKIKDGSIHFQDKRTNASYAADSIDLSLKGDTLFGPYAVDGSLVYNKEKIELEGKTGKIAKGADNVSVQAKLALPSTHTKLDFSGVAGLKAPYEVQGEIGFETDNLGAAIMPFVKTRPTSLDKPVKAKGLLTASSENFSLKNAQIGFGDLELDSSIVLTGLKQSPINVQVDLSSDKAVNLDAFLAPPKPNGKETSNVALAANDFIPAKLSLPAPFTGRVAVGLKSVVFKGQAINDVSLNTELAAKNFKGDFKAVLPGNGKLGGMFDFDYANSVKADGGNGITLTQPTLNYRMQLEASDPRKTLAGFIPPETLKSAGNILSSTLSVDAKGTVTPTTVKADGGTLTILDTPLIFSASYTPGRNGARNAIGLNVSAEKLDADAWMKRLKPEMGQEAATAEKPKKADIAGIAKSIRLPFDLDLAASIRSLHYAENDYANVRAKGRLTGNTLTIDTAGFQDEKGNTLNAVGTVADVNTLAGIDVNVSGKTPNADLLLKTFKVQASGMPANVGSAELVAALKGQADKLGFTANVKALKGSLEAQGALSDLLTEPSVSDLTFRLRHPNYVELARMYSPDFRSSIDISKNLDVFTTMQRQGKVYTFKDLKVTVGPSTMTGELKADMSGAVPSITAALQFDTLPMDKLLGAEATSDKTVEIRPTSASKASGDARWSRDAINTDWMRKWNASIKATAGNASYGNWQFTNAAMDFDLKDGTLTLSKLNGGMYGGHVTINGKLASSPQPRQPVTANATFALDNVSLESFVQSFSGSKLIRARGNVSVNADVNSTGLSPAALIFALAGKGTMKGGDIQFDGFDLARLSRTFAQPSSSMKENFAGILGSATSGGSTKFDKLDGAFTITEGVINFDKMKLDGMDADVDTAGKVNLPLWTVDLESTITLAEPKDKPPPALKVVFKGPLDNPGQTFGKGAMENYFMQQYGNKLQDQLIDKLDKKGVLQKTGLGNLLGLPQKAAVPVAAPVAAPAPVPAAAPAAAPAPEPAPVAPTAAAPNTVPDATPVITPPATTPPADPTPPAAPAPPPAASAEEKKPDAEDVMKDMLQNAITGQ